MKGIDMNNKKELKEKKELIKMFAKPDAISGVYSNIALVFASAYQYSNVKNG